MYFLYTKPRRLSLYIIGVKPLTALRTKQLAASVSKFYFYFICSPIPRLPERPSQPASRGDLGRGTVKLVKEEKPSN